MRLPNELKEMRPLIKVCFGIASLVWAGCQPSSVAIPSAIPSSTRAPVLEFTPPVEGATSPAVVELETTAAPTGPSQSDFTRLPLKLQPQSCSQQAPRSYQPIGSSHLLVAASNGPVQGLFELSLADGTARLVIEEAERIAKVAVSEDRTWLVYSTLCEPGMTCAANARPDDPSHWVVADLSGRIYSRTAWAQAPDAYAWRLLSGVPEAVKILGGVDSQEQFNSLNGASQIDLPSGHERANYFGVSDELTRADQIATHFVVSPNLTREAHYAFDPGRSEGSIRVGNLPSVVGEEWSIVDSGNVGSAGYGYRMVWSPDSTFLAATLANASIGANGDVYLLDAETRQAVQVTELVDQFANYFAAPTTWSPDGDRLAISVYADQGKDTLVADFRAGRLDSLCVESAYGDAVWDDSGRVLAIQQDPRTLWAYAADVHQLYSVTTDLSVQQVVAWLP